MVFGPRDVGHWKDNLIFVRHDVQRLEEVQHLLHTYGLFDLGLDFGPKVAPRRSDYEPQYANTYSIERRFRLLDPETAYTRERGYGWLERSGITASPAMSIPYTSLEGDNLENLALPQAVLYRDFLRGSQKLTLLVDLPDGDYRILPSWRISLSWPAAHFRYGRRARVVRMGASFPTLWPRRATSPWTLR